MEVMPTKDEIKDWMKRFNHSRAWLGEKCGGVTTKAVNNWLSTDRPIPAVTLRLITRLMSDDQVDSDGLVSKRVLSILERERRREYQEAIREYVSQNSGKMANAPQPLNEVVRLRADTELLLILEMNASDFKAFEDAAAEHNQTVTEWATETLRAASALRQ